MDLEKAAAKINDLLSRIGETMKSAKDNVIAIETEYRGYEAAGKLIECLRQCEDNPMMGCTTTIWSFVASYRLVPRGRMMRPALLELIVVPELIPRQKAPRGRPDPERENVSHWSYVEVDGDNIANQVASTERYGVRIGRTEEISTLPCPKCEAPCPIACEHDWDYDSAVQSIILYRLCLDCLDVSVIAASNGGLNDDLIKG